MTKQISTVTYGEDGGKGNIVGIQPYIKPGDYASVASFKNKIESYLAAAREAGFLSSKTIVVFPEYIGTWLVAANLPSAVHKSEKMTSAMLGVIRTKPWQWLKSLVVSGDLKKSFFLTQAEMMRSIYQETFSGLAQKYGVTIVAGSIVLPDPEIVEGVLRIRSGKLFNVSVVYKSDGKASDQLVKKVNLVPEEAGFTTPGSVEDIPVFTTPAGKLGVLVCADSWHEANYSKLRQYQAEIIAVPSYLAFGNIWEKPWHGDPKLTEKEAWLTHALPGQITKSGAKCGMNVFLRGSLWDMHSDGQTITVADGEVHVREGDDEVVTNLWI